MKEELFKNIELSRKAEKLRKIPNEERTLKNLKDLLHYEETCGKCGREVMVLDGYANESELRQEAIKWVKEDIEDYANYLRRMIDNKTSKLSFTGRLIEKWKNRFNITEEDLK